MFSIDSSSIFCNNNSCEMKLNINTRRVGFITNNVGDKTYTLYTNKDKRVSITNIPVIISTDDCYKFSIDMSLDSKSVESNAGTVIDAIVYIYTSPTNTLIKQEHIEYDTGHDTPWWSIGGLTNVYNHNINREFTIKSDTFEVNPFSPFNGFIIKIHDMSRRYSSLGIDYKIDNEWVINSYRISTC